MWTPYEGGITPHVKEIINAYLSGWGQGFNPECVFWGLPEEDTLVCRYEGEGTDRPRLGICSVGREEEVFTLTQDHPPLEDLEWARNVALVAFISLGEHFQGLSHGDLLKVGFHLATSLEECPEECPEETLQTLEKGLDVMSSIMEGVMKKVSNNH